MQWRCESRWSAGSREARFLLGALHTRRQSPRFDQAPGADLHPDIDWNAVLDLAQRHRVVPSLATGLLAGGGPVPNQVRAKLKHHAISNTRQSLFLIRKLVEILGLLDAHRIAAVPFKGPVLASRLYGDWALRQAGDLDILVHRADMVRAADVLSSRGLRATFPTSTNREISYLRSLGSVGYAAYLQSHSELHLIDDDERLTVDLHWNLAQREFGLRLDSEALWQWVEPTTLAGTPTQTFRVPELLFVLCMNGAKDCWGRLDRVCDVAELLHRFPDLDWGRTVSLAKSLGCHRMLLLGVALAAQLLDASLPAAIRRQVRADAVLIRLADQVIHDLFHSQDDEVEEASVRKSLFQLRLRERLRDRAVFCLNQFIPNIGDQAALPLPRPLSFLHYTLRPIRLTVRHASHQLARTAPRGA